jgi:methyl-accepting chemotaxis protein
MRWPKLSVRGKILGTIVVVAVAVLVAGALAAFDAVNTARQRGRYLKVQFSYYSEAITSGEASADAVARLIAADPGLQAAMESGTRQLIEAEASRLAAPLGSTIAPDYVTLSDASGSLYAMGGFKGVPESQWRDYRVFRDLLEGELKSHVGIIARKPYLLSGATVRSGDRVLGMVLIAKNLENRFWDIANSSGSGVATTQQRFSLVGTDRVIASALPESDYAGLLAALKAPRNVSEGSVQIPVLDIGSVTYDFYAEPLRGYERGSDATTHEVGTLVLIKERRSTAQFWTANWQLLTVFSLALLIAIILGYALAVQVTQPLRRYIRATEELARGHGDLTKRLEVHTNDELGSLARNLNRVFAKIHQLAAGVQRTAFQVTASSGQISAVSKQMLDGAKEQAGKVSNSTAAVTELSSSIQQVAENAAEATRTAKQSGEAVTFAIRRLQQIRRTVDDAATRIATLGESGKRIGNIVEVIRQISEQTSMLALNAAIEAAHAGEHGRGFAVVADEVSSLAKRVGQSAKDIEDLIATIRDQTGEAVRVMQDGTREVEEGTQLVETTLADLQTLIKVIDDTAAAVQEQAIASDEIARNMDAVRRIATTVVQSSENAVVEGDHLQELADQLKESVKGFKIDPERVALDEAELKQLPEGNS